MTDTLAGYLEQFRGDDVRFVEELPLGAWHGWVPSIGAKEVLVFRRAPKYDGDYEIELIIPTQWFYRPQDHEGYLTRSCFDWRTDLVIWGAEPVEVENHIVIASTGYGDLVKSEPVVSKAAAFSVTIDGASGRRLVGYNPIDGYFDYKERN